MRNNMIEIMEQTAKLMKESNFRNPLLGLEFHGKGYGVTVECITLNFNDVSYSTIEKFVEEKFEYRGADFSSIRVLEDKEWEISSYGFYIASTEGKIQIAFNRKFNQDGQYVILNHTNGKSHEVEFYNTHPWNRDSKPTMVKSRFDKVYIDVDEDIGECGKASDLEIFYIPPHHMWEPVSYDMYPCDDPGYVYGNTIVVTDKATGVEYQQ